MAQSNRAARVESENVFKSVLWENMEKIFAEVPKWRVEAAQMRSKKPRLFKLGQKNVPVARSKAVRGALFKMRRRLNSRFTARGACVFRSVHRK